jgi:hypothetical protein
MNAGRQALGMPYKSRRTREREAELGRALSVAERRLFEYRDKLQTARFSVRGLSAKTEYALRQRCEIKATVPKIAGLMAEIVALKKELGSIRATRKG